MLKSFSKKQIIIGLSLISITLVVLITSVAFALSRPKLIFFYTDWNAKCRAAKPVIESVASSYGNRIEFVEINMDSPFAPDQMRSLGVAPPRTIPYIIVTDRYGNVAFERLYTGESSQQLRSMIDPIVGQ